MANGLKIEKAIITTIWGCLSEENENEYRSFDGGVLFGEKAKNLIPIISMDWRGKVIINSPTKKHFIITPGIEIDLSTYEGNNYAKLSDIEKAIIANNKIYENPFKEKGSIQKQPFIFIDILLKEPFPENYKTIYASDIIDLLNINNQGAPILDYDILNKIGLMQDDKLLNYSSLSECFLTLYPKNTIVIRYGIKNEYILPSILEALTIISICFIGYSSLIREIAKWENDLYESTKEIVSDKKIGPVKNGNAKDKTNNNITPKINRHIYELIKTNYRASQLLDYHMSYVTSSAVAQKYFQTFVSISGLKELQESMITRLKNADRLINYMIDLFQFTEMERLEH